MIMRDFSHQLIYAVVVCGSQAYQISLETLHNGGPIDVFVKLLWSKQTLISGLKSLNLLFKLFNVAGAVDVFELHTAI